MGRQSANEGFLTAWFRHSGHAEFWCLARQRDEAQVFAQLGERIHAGLDPKPVYRWIAQQSIQRAGEIGTVFVPGPQVADIAWMRRRHASSSASDFSIIGMTHTTCEMPIQDALANMLTAPVYPWDAQICPSASVQTMVRRLLDDEAAWLREHIGATRITPPQLPVIPLGVDCAALDLPAAEHMSERKQWRAQWGLEEDEICVLFLGRLDLRTKANLLPTFDALQLAARQLRARGGPRLRLVLAGWFASEWDEKTLRDAAPVACPDVPVVFEDGRSAGVRRGAWHAADIFTSLVDNVQETFGLTPIEAMAAGLPVVVTDYDGYRESVRDGIDGFRIRTWQPAAGAGIGLMDQHADLLIGYQSYVNQASALIGIDIAQAAAAYVRLASDPALRRQMGDAGRQRARVEYDWAGLLHRFDTLFETLALDRQASARVSTANWAGARPAPDWGARNPRRSDPFHSFSHYPTATLTESAILLPGPLMPGEGAARESALRAQLERPVYANLRQRLDTPLLRELLRQVAESPDGLPWQRWAGSTAGAADLLPTVGWLVKSGLVRIA